MINGKAKYCRCRSRICRCFSYKILGKETEKEDVAITLIDRHSYHTMMTELHEVAGGRVEPEAINTICSICLLVKRMYNLSQTL